MRILLWPCAGIALVVFATMIVCTIKFDAAPGGSRKKSVSGKLTDVLWVLVPIAIVSATAISALRMSVFVN